MLLRICLIIALVGGLAAATVNMLVLQKNITATIADRDDHKDKQEKAEADAKKTHTELTKSQNTLKTTQRELTQTKSDLDSANGKVSALEKNVTDLHDQLVRTQGERDKSDQELSKWSQLNLSPALVVKMEDDLKKAQAARDAVIAENKMVKSKLDVVSAELATLVNGTETIPLEPPGLTGKIVAVDPKFDFVVVDIGEDKQVVPRGIMLVAREGKLIGKIQIARVEKNQCIGTLMPQWTRGDVMEGDQVLD
jgi:chromosome segregation ATPase